MYLEVGDYSSARLKLLDPLKKGPADAESRAMIEALWLQAGIEADKAANEHVHELLERASMDMEVKDYAAAQESILKAIEAAPQDPTLRAVALRKWRKAHRLARTTAHADAEKKKRRQRAILEEAARKYAEGGPEKAGELALSVLTDTDDRELAKLARRILRARGPTAAGTLRKLGGLSYERFLAVAQWGIDFVFAIALLSAVYLVFRSARCAWSIVTRLQSKWLLEGFEDSTGLGMAEPVLDSFSRWSQGARFATSGLLRLETMRLPSVPLMTSKPVLDITSVLQSLAVPVAGASLSGLATSLPSLRKWLNATRPRIRGSALIADTLLTVRLTAVWASGRSVSVACSAPKEQAAAAAEAATYKMYYVLSKFVASQAPTEAKAEAAKAEVEAANKLREGLGLLQKQLVGESSAELSAAREVFRSVRTEWPGLTEAYLYEGIALDLSEQHDEAIKRFQYLEQAQDISQALREKACYNEGVSRLRKYEPAELCKAIQIFEQLVGQPVDGAMLLASPIKSLALAAKANALAHQPLFWQELALNVPPTDDPLVIRQRKTQAASTVSSWLEEVLGIAAVLTLVIASVKEDETWDTFARHQLKWAVRNAWGNVHLNFATGFLKASVLDPHEKAACEQHLHEAYDAFQDCEILLPPGVETLSNLGTVASQLGRQEEARRYLQRVVEFNPDYEYAYYRMAQSWESEGNTSKVLEVLRNFAKRRTPRIRSFLHIYGTHSVELAQT